jgi:tetratricopeptide (TPR) repeat protein
MPADGVGYAHLSSFSDHSNEVSMDHYAGIFGKQNRDEAFEEAKRAREKLMTKQQTGSERSVLFNRACALMLDQKFEETIVAYRAMARQFPADEGLCEAQIGAALFFLDRHDEAIASYLKALALGQDATMLAENVFEACEALAQQHGDPTHYRRYLEAFPEGGQADMARERFSAG